MTELYKSLKLISYDFKKSSCRVKLGITPQDPKEPDCCYFNIWIERKITNVSNGDVFDVETYHCFKVQNKNEAPSIQFFFSLIDSATLGFAVVFQDKTKGTTLQHHRIPKPVLSDLESNIQKCIDIWKNTIQKMNLN